MTQSQVRATRADAVRNRTAILDAARQQIAEHGSAASMDQIAQSAGVAVGTLYRHFPTKTDLVGAVVAEFVTRVADAAETAADRLTDGRPAFDELAGLLRSIFKAAATDRAVKAAALALNADVDDSADVQRASHAFGKLISAAQADGAVRSDLSIDDLYLMVNSAPADESAQVLDRWVELILFGIVGVSTKGGQSNI